MRKMNDSQKYKRKVRNSKRWKEFRKELKNKRKNDELTNSKLSSRFQLHHLDMSEENYDDFNEDNYCCLNVKSHETIHFLFTYYKKDLSILERLKEILNKMLMLNK